MERPVEQQQPAPKGNSLSSEMPHRPRNQRAKRNWEDMERKATEGEQGSKESSQQWLRSRGRTRGKTLLQILTPTHNPFSPVSILVRCPEPFFLAKEMSTCGHSSESRSRGTMPSRP